MLRVYLTGEPCLTSGPRLLRSSRLPGRQGRLLFAYLVVERSRPVPRDELSESIWPERRPAAYDVALSAIVSKLRALFAEIGVSGRALSVASGCYRLDLPPRTWIDTETAIESVHLAEAALLADDPQAAYGPAVVAGAILRRPFLPGEEGPWIDRQRDSLRNARLRALDCLAQIHSANHEFALALRAAQEAVELEPFREEGYRRLMLIHHAAGNGAEAIRAYARLNTLLNAELGASPGPETRRVFEDVGGEFARLLTRLTPD